MRQWLLGLLCLLLFWSACHSSRPETHLDLTIGSKDFTEQNILGEIMAQLIENQTPLHVHRKLNLGGVLFTFEALKTGKIDLYPEYTGTGLITILKEKTIHDPAQIMPTVEQLFDTRYQLRWSQPFGFNNTYVIAVRSNDARLKNIQTLSELATQASWIKLGMPQEFLARRDGYDYLKQAYHLIIPSNHLIAMDAGLMYTALKEKNVDAIIAFSTDGRIPAFQLRLLQDNHNIFPPYQAAALIRKETLQKYPPLLPLLNRLAGKISDDKMREMNFLADNQGIPPSQIAHTFLVQEGLIPNALHDSWTPSHLSTNFWVSAWHQRGYLANLIEQHLFLTVTAVFCAILLSLPLGVILTRRARLANPVFVLINILQTIPSLALLGFLIPVLGIGTLPALAMLFLYAMLPLVRNTYTGIRQVDPFLKETCQGLGLTDWQILTKLELPLAFPVIMAGIRTSTVLIVGTATLAAFVGAGGLGEPIFRGISAVNTDTILLGAIPAALLTVTLDFLLQQFEKSVCRKFQLIF